MKRFLFLTMFVFIALMAVVSVYQKEEKPLTQKLEQAMRLTRMNEYHDDDYGYVVRYPSFFEQTSDSLMDRGCCRFSFWQDSILIEQSVFVEQNTEGLSIDGAMKSYASDLHATKQQKGDDYFILSGVLFNDTSHIPGRHYYMKFVQHRKLWFVQSLVYPKECEGAMNRVKREIDGWEIW